MAAALKARNVLIAFAIGLLLVALVDHDEPQSNFALGMAGVLALLAIAWPPRNSDREEREDR